MGGAPAPPSPAGHAAPADLRELRLLQRPEAPVSQGPAVQGPVISWERRPPGGLVRLRVSPRSPCEAGAAGTPAASGA